MLSTDTSLYSFENVKGLICENTATLRLLLERKLKQGNYHWDPHFTRKIWVEFRNDKSKYFKNKDTIYACIPYNSPVYIPELAKDVSSWRFSFYKPMLDNPLYRCDSCFIPKQRIQHLLTYFFSEYTWLLSKLPSENKQRTIVLLKIFQSKILKKSIQDNNEQIYLEFLGISPLLINMISKYNNICQKLPF